MATDTTPETDTDTAGTESAESTGTEAARENGSAAAGGTATDTTATATGTAEDDAQHGTPTPVSGGLLAGAGAIVSAALGLVSLTGTSLTDMLRDRAQLLGQIEAATGMPGDQIAALYGNPWNAAATVNGVFALLAVVVGALLVAGPAARAGAVAWARPVAFGGLVLGVIGVLVAGGMYLDLFASEPTLPAMPGLPGMPG